MSSNVQLFVLKNARSLCSTVLYSISCPDDGTGGVFYNSRSLIFCVHPCGSCSSTTLVLLFPFQRLKFYHAQHSSNVV